MDRSDDCTFERVHAGHHVFMCLHRRHATIRYICNVEEVKRHECSVTRPGGGFLSLLDAQGQILDWRIVDGLEAPLGMALLDDRLHLVDNNRLRE
jgi:hypothetical protein